MGLIRRYRASLAFIGYVALSIAVVLTFARGEDTRNIVQRVTHPPTVQNTCPSFKKVGYPCPKPGSKADKQIPHSRNRNGGDADQTPSTGRQRTSPPSGGRQVSKPQRPKRPAPPVSAAPALPTQPSPLPPPASPKAEPPGLLDPTVDQVKGTVCKAAPVAAVCP